MNTVDGRISTHPWNRGSFPCRSQIC